MRERIIVLCLLGAMCAVAMNVLGEQVALSRQYQHQLGWRSEHFEATETGLAGAERDHTRVPVNTKNGRMARLSPGPQGLPAPP